MKTKNMRHALKTIMEYGKDNESRVELIMALFHIGKRRKINL